MKFDSINTVIFSPTGGSETIANKVTDVLKAELPEEYIDRKVKTLLTQTPADGNIYIKNSIAVVAAPVYGGRVAELAISRFENLKGVNSIAVPIVVFGNRDYEDALIELSDLLERRGFKTIAGGAFIGEHSYSRPDMPTAEGRPDADDLAKAEDFAKKIAEKILKAEDIASLTAPEIKGNRPYKEKGPSKPQTPLCDYDLCLKCGNCALICPNGAIEVYSEGPIFDSDLCIKCCACVKQCPGEALTFETPYTEILFKNCHERKEPEIFL